MLRAGTRCGAATPARLLTGAAATCCRPSSRSRPISARRLRRGDAAARSARRRASTRSSSPPATTAPTRHAALLTHQTLWARNHNWHVDQLAAKHPDWSQEQIFNAARAMNEAEYQHVVYDEYLAKLLGPGRSPATRATSPASIRPPSTNGRRPPSASATTSPATPRPARRERRRASADGDARDPFARERRGHARTERGAATTGSAASSPGARRRSTARSWTATATLLFGHRRPTVDLDALDIQRGRDHGVQDINTLREGLGLRPYESFAELRPAERRPTPPARHRADRCGNVYTARIDHLDAVVAGLLERNVRGLDAGRDLHASDRRCSSRRCATATGSST